MTTYHKKPNAYVSHVQLNVSNLARSIEYYTTIIGFTVFEQTATTAYLSADGKTSLVSINEVPEAVSAKGYTGLYHFALLASTSAFYSCSASLSILFPASLLPRALPVQFPIAAS